jgi:hypothetical protein
MERIDRVIGEWTDYTVDPGIIDEDVQPTELVDDRAKCLFHCQVVGDVHGAAGGVLADLLRRLAGTLDVQDRYVRTLGGQALGDAKAYT